MSCRTSCSSAAPSSRTARQVEHLPEDASHLALSVGGNDALRCLPVLDAPMPDVRQALTVLGAVAIQFESQLQPSTTAASPTPPSSTGGEKIARAVAAVVTGDGLHRPATRVILA